MITEDDLNESLVRRRYRLGNGVVITMFPSAMSALGHVCDHVLTFPESTLWYRRFGEMSQDLKMPNRKGLANLAGKCWRVPLSDNVQDVYNRYCEVIAREFDSAVQVGWCFTAESSEHQIRFAFGVNGTYCVMSSDTLFTAFYSGLPCPMNMNGKPTLEQRQEQPRPRRYTYKVLKRFNRMSGERAGPDLEYGYFKAGFAKYKKKLISMSRRSGEEITSDTFSTDTRTPGFDEWRDMCISAQINDQSELLGDE